MRMLYFTLHMYKCHTVCTAHARGVLQLVMHRVYYTQSWTGRTSPRRSAGSRRGALRSRGWVDVLQVTVHMVPKSAISLYTKVQLILTASTH